MIKSPKRISILGSTGSIGRSTMSIIEDNPAEFKIVGLCAGKNLDLLCDQIVRHRPSYVSVREEKDAEKLHKLLVVKTGRSFLPEIYYGDQGAENLATLREADITVSAIVGSAALRPTYLAVKAGKRIALANKESIVMAGRIIMNEAKKSKASILPVDSEHSAIFQSMLGHNRKDIKRLILTASGGPFYNRKKNNLRNVKLAEVLDHPNWKMGRKITVDSATLMNKALEVIEARWLFDIPPEKISVMIHRESIVHSIVEYKDGSMIAQMGIPDMRVPISYALTYPERINVERSTLNLEEVGKLTFAKPDPLKFPSLDFAYETLSLGDSAAVVLNAANEASVYAFLCGKIKFLEIPVLIKRVFKQHKAHKLNSIGDALDIHGEFTLLTNKLIERL